MTDPEFIEDLKQRLARGTAASGWFWSRTVSRLLNMYEGGSIADQRSELIEEYRKLFKEVMESEIPEYMMATVLVDMPEDMLKQQVANLTFARDHKKKHLSLIPE